MGRSGERTRAEARDEVRHAFTTDGDLDRSDDDIIRQCRVPLDLVIEVRSEMEAEIIKALASEGVESGANPTPNDADQAQEHAPVTQKTATPMPEVRDAYEGAARAIGRLRVDVLKGVQAGSLHQRVEKSMRDAESALRFAVPIFCTRCEGAGCPACDQRGWLPKWKAERR